MIRSVDMENRTVIYNCLVFDKLFLRLLSLFLNLKFLENIWITNKLIYSFKMIELFFYHFWQTDKNYWLMFL